MDYQKVSVWNIKQTLEKKKTEILLSKTLKDLKWMKMLLFGNKYDF